MMLDWLDQIDKQLFLLFNAQHSTVSDQIWIWITNIPTWIPLYVILLFFMIKIFKKDGIYVIVGLLLVVLFSDQFTSSFLRGITNDYLFLYSMQRFKFLLR